MKSPEWVAFYGLMQVNAHVIERVGEDLEQATGLSLPWVELLMHLNSHDGRMRMNELADMLLLSRGGATRLVAKLEEAGLVEREIPASDRRATFAVLTERGRDAVERAAPLQAGLVQRYFGEHLSEREALQLVRIFDRVLRDLDADCKPITEMVEATRGGHRAA